ncbi:MAG: class I SAM-dependent methyltransferase [Rhodobacteraceae bacterium]|jgi:SAM-dependent methyltransferase|nr:class I SAM-dependent methyltransferase [Paracoccaceae bacterium]MBL4558162.1 class I SAM-dependent methyltransferase [Paracoccaceae bacterium]
MTIKTEGFSSADYWERRYAGGGNSGAGSCGRLADFKATFLNRFFANNDVQSVLEFGCGDGNQLDLLEIERYTGFDISPTVVAQCRERFADKEAFQFLSPEDARDLGLHDLTLSLDVLFHLIEPQVFADYIAQLFAHSTRHVVIYSSNFDSPWPSAHVLHRNVRKFIQDNVPHWHLNAIIPNAYPYRGDDVDNTSFCDFLIYSKPGISCELHCPGRTEV